MLKKYDPKTLYAAHGLYHNAVEVPAGMSLVFSSGIIGADATGRIIPDAPEQIYQAWRNVRAFLEGINAAPDHLVRITMHLTDRDHLDLSKSARIEALGEQMNAAVTGLITGLFDPALHIEIDVVAARPDESAAS